MRGARHEAAGRHAEHLGDLPADAGGQDVDRLVVQRDQLGGLQDALEVSLADAGSALLATPPQGQLADQRTDRHQQHGHLDVVGVGDGEAAVGLGEEEVEPGAAGQRRDQPGDPVPAGGHGHHDHDQQQADRGHGDALAHRGEQRRDGERNRRADRDQPAAGAAFRRYSGLRLKGGRVHEASVDGSLPTPQWRSSRSTPRPKAVAVVGDCDEQVVCKRLRHSLEGRHATQLVVHGQLALSDRSRDRSPSVGVDRRRFSHPWPRGRPRGARQRQRAPPPGSRRSRRPGRAR